MKPTIESFDIYTGVLKSISDRTFEGDWIKLEDFKKAIKLQEEVDTDRIINFIENYKAEYVKQSKIDNMTDTFDNIPEYEQGTITGITLMLIRLKEFLKCKN